MTGTAAGRRREAAHAGHAGDVDTARRLLADADPSVRATALGALDRLGAATAADVVAALTDDDPLCREASVAALGAVGDDRGLSAVLAATRDKPAVRRRAVIALAAFEGPDVDAALQRALTDRDWQVRQAAEDLLAE